MAVGVVLTSFGLKGDLKVEPLTDFPERFEPGEQLWLAGKRRTVERSRWQRGTVFVKLRGIDTPEAVAPLRGYPLEVPQAERAALEEGQYFQSDIVGLRVRTSGDEEVGQVTEFLPTGANDVLVVHGPRGEVLVPMIADVVQAIDLVAGTITIEPIDGLLPEPRVERAPRLPAWRYKQLRRSDRTQAAPSDSSELQRS
ncbi:MAG TPA: ribosome maturation factor RimM [Dehalococcoidia bacterium]